ncbi:hypothetical protein LVB87_12230 [Lysobacter sp. KIS68-7]|uniref:hypothetical protein n=1 Tax=Lysobacter sp. KIS68-7 TaxID=2904252 RepID=UPI001E5115D7|nr:hypothetical protein [Lysobacter sp. KIS68-7]UHQ18946.1 hypothetical protein LVB87_12230 [Lysobacter sp. KIS68-7]
MAATAFGFTVGGNVVAWQAVTEIWGFKTDLITTDEAFLEFSFGGQAIVVGEDQPGFTLLESAMVAAFPSTAGWRQTVLQPAFAPCRTLLFRRV